MPIELVSMPDILNDRPFEHRSRFGTHFTADRCDFATGVTVRAPAHLREGEYVSDIAEMIGFHATNVLERLNGFQGYDAIGFEFVGDRR